MKKKTKLVIFVSFLLAMGAGVAVGVLGARTIPVRNTARDPQSWLITELQLSADQQDKMKQIWAELLQAKGRQYGEEMRQIQERRDTAIASLMTPEQKQLYARINQDFMQQSIELWQRMEQDFTAASERTKQLLDDSQKRKFQAIMDRFRADHRPPAWDGAGRAPAGPATRESVTR